MRRLIDDDLANIIGTTIESYYVEAARIKRGAFIDSDHYGILLGKNQKDHYVTWQWHLLEDESVSVYFGHYHMKNLEAALQDYNNRDLNKKQFKVTITETLKKTVEVEAKDQDEAEQIVSNKWKNSEYILDADHFYGVEFETVPGELD